MQSEIQFDDIARMRDNEFFMVNTLFMSTIKITLASYLTMYTYGSYRGNKYHIKYRN